MIKKILIAIPKGAKFIEITIPEETVNFMLTRAIMHDLPNGNEFSHIVWGEYNNK